MLDCVELMAEKEKYTKHGVHKGMQGWICLDDNSNSTWLVNFPQYGGKKDIATISVKEDDMKIIPRMDARINERINAQFDETEDSEKKSFDDKPDDLSDYMI